MSLEPTCPLCANHFPESTAMHIYQTPYRQEGLYPHSECWVVVTLTDSVGTQEAHTVTCHYLCLLALDISAPSPSTASKAWGSEQRGSNLNL